MLCNICCEPYTPCLRKKVSCQYCPFEACQRCVRTYLLSDTSGNGPRCMSPTCQREWIPEFMASTFPRLFLTGEYKQHRENILFDRETSYLPATQLAIEHDRRIQSVREEFNKIKRAIRSIAHERHLLLIGRYSNVAGNGEFYSKWTALNERLDNAIQERRAIRVRLQQTIQAAPGNNSQKESSASEKKQFIRACPKDGCKGFLSTAWKCTLCHTHVCKDCHEIITPSSAPDNQQEQDVPAPVANEEEAPPSGGKSRHVCTEESLQTAKLLAKDSKPCPNCASLIFKVDGCDQMFCTVCHTAFSWRTSQVVTNGRIHNPHYYEWLRSRNGGVIPREPGDDPCGGAAEMPDIYELRNLMYYWPHSREMDELFVLHREIMHVQHFEMHRFRSRQTVDINMNMDIRKKYMLNEISEAKFKVLLQRREKAQTRNHEYHQIFEMFVRVASDSITGLIRNMHTHTLSDVQQCVDTIQKLRQYTVESLHSAARRFGAVSPVRGIFNA